MQDEQSGADLVKVRGRTIVGAIALVHVVISLKLAIEQTAYGFGLRWPYAGWMAAAAWMTVGSVLVLLLRLGLWLLVARRRGSVLLLSALIVAAANYGFIVFFAKASDGVMLLMNWVGPIGVALLVLGLLRSRLVAPWIAWLGMAEVLAYALRIVVPTEPFLGGVSVSSILVLLYWVLLLGFNLAIAASLLAHTEAGKRDAEQALQPCAPKVGIES